MKGYDMKKMKNFLLVMLFLIAGLALVPGSASAVQFDLDLNTITAGYGDYTDIFRIQIDGFSSVTQDLGADGIITVGDTFSEMSLFQLISYKHFLGDGNSFFTGLSSQNKQMYIYAQDLSGYVSNVSAVNVFDYVFTNGTNLGIYIGAAGALGYTAGDELVASFTFNKGDGAASDGFLGGIANSGSTRITWDFDNSTPDAVWEALGLDLGNLPAGLGAFAEFNTTNQLILPTLVYYDSNDNPVDPTQTQAAYFKADVNSTGHMTVNVVPEPGTLALFGFGLIFLSGVVRKQFNGKKM